MTHTFLDERDKEEIIGEIEGAIKLSETIEQISEVIGTEPDATNF